MLKSLLQRFRHAYFLSVSLRPTEHRIRFARILSDGLFALGNPRLRILNLHRVEAAPCKDDNAIAKAANSTAFGYNAELGKPYRIIGTSKPEHGEIEEPSESADLTAEVFAKFSDGSRKAIAELTVERYLAQSGRRNRRPPVAHAPKMQENLMEA